MKTKTAKSTPAKPARGNKGVARALVGIRVEPGLIKVLKGIAELRDRTLGELVEEIVVAAMEGGCAFADGSGRVPAELKRSIASLRQVYGFDLTLQDLRRR